VTQIVRDLGVAWFLGAGGLVLGAVAGATTKRTLGRAWVRGALLGVGVGCVLSVELVREVVDSSSSTAALGIIFVPFPPITNGITGVAAAVIVRGWRIGRTLTPRSGQ
jgi:hypothetical protein